MPAPARLPTRESAGTAVTLDTMYLTGLAHVRQAYWERQESESEGTRCMLGRCPPSRAAC